MVDTSIYNNNNSNDENDDDGDNNIRIMTFVKYYLPVSLVLEIYYF